jgi:hypothetical protein
MLKRLISLALALGCIKGATICTFASCRGFGSVSGTTSASCPGADAEIVANPVYQDSVNIQANSGGSDIPHGDQGTFASATFIDDYILTVTGGTGQGFFVPCLSTIGEGFADGTASASFGNFSIEPGSTNCDHGQRRKSENAFHFWCSPDVYDFPSVVSDQPIRGRFSNESSIQ